MQITLQSTTKIVEINGVPARIWEGKTANGIEVHAFITRVAVNNDDDASEFEKDLKRHEPPKNADIQAYPLRMII